MTETTRKPAAADMIARRIDKPNTQAMIRALRAAGLEVTRDSLGAYRCTMTQHMTRKGERTGETRELLLFAALPGRRDYLVRMRSDLFSN